MEPFGGWIVDGDSGTTTAVTDQIDELVAQARGETGLEDLGDATWRDGLEVLVRSADAEGRFNTTGRAGFDAELVRNLCNRLRVEHWYAQHPEIDDQVVEVELLGVGFPRTGSTALAAMLGEDPTVRSLRMWESATPCPPPGVSPGDDAARLAAAEHVLVLQDQMEPRLKSMLPQSATGPFEDHDLVALTFTSQHFLATAHVPSYGEWYLQCDMVPAYRYEKRVLEGAPVEQCPPTRWWLKSPTHTLFLEAREQVFPETRYVMTHRDVSKVLPSVADLYTVMLGFANEGIDPIEVGRLNMEQWGAALDRVLAFRDTGRDDRFFDIGFSAFQADPIAEIRGLYEWLGRDFTAEIEQRMRAWRDANPRDGGGHRLRRRGVRARRRVDVDALRRVPGSVRPAPVAQARVR